MGAGAIADVDQLYRFSGLSLSFTEVLSRAVNVFQLCVGAYLYPNNHSKGPVRQVVIERKLKEITLV